MPHRVLNVIRDRFWTTGIAGMSAYDLMEATGPGKGSIYGQLDTVIDQAGSIRYRPPRREVGLRLRHGYRGDTRAPDEVIAAGGFMPQAPGASTSLR